MADSSAMADLRGLDVDKLAKGFAEESNVLKNFVNVSKTSAREIRWFQKTAGFLDTADTTAVTGSHIGPGTAFKARPFVTEQTWTRNTSYIKKFFVESPWLSMEDIKDSDIDLLAGNVRDLTRAVARKVDLRIWSVLTEAAAATPTIPNPTNVNTAAAVADGWDDAVTGDPITDILVGKQNIRSNGYDPEGCVLYINSIEHRNLLAYLINVKGSSIPAFSSEKIKSGVVMELLGCKVVVSENATTDYALMFVPKTAATWKSFMPITSVTVQDPGIGTKIRVWEEGECILTDPKAVHVITDTVV